MFQKIALILLVLLVLLTAGCSKRRTRQFILPDERAEGFRAGEWLIDAPSVIAFRDVINLKEITDTTMFWVSLRAKRPVAGDPDTGPDLLIDSISITFHGDNERYWRHPTRTAPFNKKGDDHIRKLFDFFGDQGIVIPAGIDTITVEFEAVSVFSDNQLREKQPVKILMVRDEQALRVPLLQE